MSDTSVNYQGVADGARQLREIRRQLDEQTNQLQQKIKNLTASGGFTTDVGSSSLDQAVTRFKQANTTALGALERMAGYLDTIPEMYQQADNQYRSIFDRYNPG
jgi:uncharacterized phage infection (PIP) family protein YhgE